VKNPTKAEETLRSIFQARLDWNPEPPDRQQIERSHARSKRKRGEWMLNSRASKPWRGKGQESIGLCLG